MPSAADDFEFVRDTGLLEPLIADGLVIPESRVDPKVLGPLANGARYVLEHPRLPFVSYPYEWSFAALKSAALLHLDIHLKALDHQVTLSDASAYNIQFQGCRPLFIDSLSFRRYRQGEYWIGHRQFCEQFLVPLLFRAILGIPHNAWYRGSLDGVSVQEFSRLVPLRYKFSWNVLTHIVLQASFQRTSTNHADVKIPKKLNFPLAAFERMLRGLRKWIQRLKPAGTGRTVWSTYAEDNSYSSAEAQKKRTFIAEVCESIKPAMLWDIGCNTGEYSKVALEAGTQYAVGFDFDPATLDLAMSRAQQENLNFLPLFLDAANPTPNQGWAEQERAGLARRASADAVLALALVHHLAISRNVPLREVIAWLLSMAPNGIVEFVQKTDPMVQQLMRLRDDIFEDYNEESFVHHLQSRAKIIRTMTVSDTNRRLYWYARRNESSPLTASDSQ